MDGHTQLLLRMLGLLYVLYSATLVSHTGLHFVVHHTTDKPTLIVTPKLTSGGLNSCREQAEDEKVK